MEHANEDERDGAEEVLDLAIESMYLRLRRSGRIPSSVQSAAATEGRGGGLNTTEMKSIISTMPPEELGEVDPNWQIYVVESSDGGTGVWPYWYLQNEMAPLLGYERMNYATRSTQRERYMDSWVRKLDADGDPTLTFDAYVGRPINFTDMEFEGNHILERGLRSVQNLQMSVREDIVSAIDEYMKSNHPNAYDRAVQAEHGKFTGEDGDGRDVSYHLSEDVARLRRPTDVRTFWNGTVCNMHCSFRNRISDIVRTMPQRRSGGNGTGHIVANTDVVGYIHNKGRNNVHPDFISGMLTTKIIVLAQRDRWEGHSRLFEALLSGALVLHDPQVYWPHGTVDGENLVVYNSWIDLELKVLHYLDPRNDEERIRIGRRGRETALLHHRTWRQAERLFLNDMAYRSDNGLANKPWSEKS